MPLARRDTFKKGGGGILRKQDGVIVGIQFSDVNPFFKNDKPAKKGESVFKPLWAILSILVDGATEAIKQTLKVGDSEVFGVTEDGQGVTSEPGVAFGKNGWTIFYNSLVDAGFPEEERIPEDPNGEVADYSGIVGSRVRFDWQKNEYLTGKLGQRKSKDGKSGYDREDLIVTAFYDFVEVEDGEVVPQPTGGKSQSASKAAPAKAAKPGKSTKVEVDIAAVATAAVQAILGAAKDNKLPLAKVSVKMLNQLGDQTAEVRDEARQWLEANPTGIEGVDYDAATKTLSI